jgi:DNA-binding response OmpR family regulator
MSPKVLIFTQNKALAAFLSDGLGKRDFDVVATSSKKKMCDMVSAGRPDFLLVDGQIDRPLALDFCSRLRLLNPNAHVIMVASTRQNSELIDACIIAPVTLRKVQYHIRALLRIDARNLIVAGDVELDSRNRVVRCAGREEQLTPKEVRLLRLLMERAGSVVTRADIMKEVWDTEYLGDTRTVDVHIRWLRKKIETTPSQPAHIHTIRKNGYRFNVLATPPAAAEQREPEAG